MSAFDWFGAMAFYQVGLALWGTMAGRLGVGMALWLAFAIQAATTLALLAVPDIRRRGGTERA